MTFSIDFYPVKANQTSVVFKVYYTKKISCTFCDEPGMKLLGTLNVKIPDIQHGRNRPIEFSLTFAKIEIKATAKNT